MHINKANKSTKRLPPGQTQRQASFSKPLKTNCFHHSFSLSLSFFLSSFFLSLLVYFHALEMSRLMLPCILMHFLYTSVSFLAHCIAEHPGRKWAFRFRKCFWEKDFRVAAVSKPAILGWYLFCLTVRRYQTHNIQYFTVCDGFFFVSSRRSFLTKQTMRGFLKAIHL